MNKKFVNLLLASVLTAGSVQVFTSCKDNEADLLKEQQYQYEKLADRVKANEDAIAELQKGLKDVQDDLADHIKDAKEALDKAIKDLNKAINDKADALGIKIDNLDEKMMKELAARDTTINNLQNQITNNFNKLNELTTKYNDVTERIEALEKAKEAIEGRVDSVEKLAEALGLNVDTLKSDLAELNVTVTDQGSRLAITELAVKGAQADIEALKKWKNDTLELRLGGIENVINNWKTIIPEIQTTANEAKALAEKNKSDLATLSATVDTVEAAITKLIDADAAQDVIIAGLESSVDSIFARLDGFVANEVFNDTVASINEKIKALQEENEALRQLAMDNYRKSIGYTNLMIEQVLSKMSAYDGLQGQIDDMKDDIAGIKGTVGDFQKELEKVAEANRTAINALQTQINELLPKLENINSAISSLSDRIEEVAGRITSIVLQGTHDQIFGSLRLPLGIQSNVLVGYLGEVDNGGGYVEFPLVNETAGTYNGDLSNTLTAAEAQKLGVAYASEHPTADVPIQTIEGQFMTETKSGNGYLGHVFATINPSKANLNGVEFKMVNSRGQQVTETLNFVPCTDTELEFGYSRAGYDNNFYYAEASVAPKDFNSIRFTFDENLKSTVKDILKAPRASANVQTVMQLANAIYGQFNGFLPAIGVEASWNDTKSGVMKVTSNYGIATATVHPLSFAFLYGYKPGKHIPHLMPALDKIKDKFEVAFDEIKGKLTIKLYDPENPFTIGSVTLEAPEIHIDLNPSAAEPVVIDVPEIWVDQVVSVNPDGSTVTEKVKVFDGFHQVIDVAADINSMIAELKANLEQSLSGITESFDTTNEQLQKLTADIAKQVNDLLQGMQETVDKTIDDLLADVQGKVNGVLNSNKVSSVIGKLDKVISKLNNMMDNANYYLQPTLLYSNNNHIGMLSANEAVPSVFVADKQTVALHVIPTTYTYELVAPAAKKYVAVTRAWRNGDASKTTIDHIFAEANNRTGKSPKMNEVINGADRMVFVTLQKGYTYEVFYQAMDYSGYVSGRKYYICVK